MFSSCADASEQEFIRLSKTIGAIDYCVDMVDHKLLDTSIPHGVKDFRGVINTTLEGYMGDIQEVKPHLTKIKLVAAFERFHTKGYTTMANTVKGSNSSPAGYCHLEKQRLNGFLMNP